MKFISVILIVLLFVISDGSSSKAEPLQLKGDFIQGGLVFGVAPPEVKIIVNDRRVRVSASGKFIFGFMEKPKNKNKYKKELGRYN